MIIGILNWNRNVKSILDSVKEVNADKKIIICSNQPKIDDISILEWHESPVNVAAARNLLMDRAKELGERWLFILEDDILVKDPQVFEKYCTLMDEFETSSIFYGFDKNLNQIMNNIPNPCIIVKLNENGDELFCNRLVCSTVMGFDMDRIEDERFDEDLLVMECEEWYQRLYNLGLNPFNGFYFDVNNSWESFKSLNLKPERVKTIELAKQDQEILKEKEIELKLEVSADKLLNWLKEKYC